MTQRQTTFKTKLMLLALATSGLGILLATGTTVANGGVQVGSASDNPAAASLGNAVTSLGNGIQSVGNGVAGPRSGAVSHAKVGQRPNSSTQSKCAGVPQPSHSWIATLSSMSASRQRPHFCLPCDLGRLWIVC